MINQLITSLYEPHVSLPSDEIFYQEVLKEIDFYHISSQVYFFLEKQRGFEKTPLFFHRQLKKNYQAALYQNIFIKKQTECLLKTFETLGVETIPLKGVYFAEKYFGHIGARGTTDIDLLIRKKHMAKAVKAVKELGFKIEEEPIPSHFHTSFSKKIPGSPYPLTVEIHWDILKETTSNFQIEEFWAESVPLAPYQMVKALSDDHTFYMICLHGWRHNLDSPKYFLDIIQMLYVLKGRLRYEDLFEQAKQHQTLKRMKRTLSIVYKEYPMLENVVPLAANQKEERKRAGKRKKSSLSLYAQFISYQFLSYDSIRHSSVEFALWLFPSRTDLLNQLKQEKKRSSYFPLLSCLYTKRCMSAVKAFMSIF